MCAGGPPIPQQALVLHYMYLLLNQIELLIDCNVLVMYQPGIIR